MVDRTTATGNSEMIDIEYLQSHALFGGLSSDELEAIVPLLETHHYGDGAYAVREDQIGSSMFFIRKGAAQVLKHNAKTGEEVQLAVLKEGDTFGEMELVDTQRRSASVKALGQLTVLVLSAEDLYEIFENDDHAFIVILMNIARELSRRLRRMDDRIVDKPELGND